MQLGLLGILGLIFVTLKLIGTITWSWWFVLLPFYGGFILWLIIILFVALVAAIAGGR
jgi:hypothetical protein